MHFQVFEEIKRIVGVDRFPTYDDKSNLPYTEAVILEIQRFRPVVPLVGRESIRDSNLAGYFIPKGSKILMNIWATGHDPLKWDDPYDFVPERFLSPDGKRVCHNDSHIPFGIGKVSVFSPECILGPLAMECLHQYENKYCSFVIL